MAYLPTFGEFCSECREIYHTLSVWDEDLYHGYYMFL